MTLLDDVRAVGLPMQSWYSPHTFTTRDDDGAEREATRQTFVGWTTDENKATAAHELGAQLRPYRSSDERFTGWEVVVHVLT